MEIANHGKPETQRIEFTSSVLFGRKWMIPAAGQGDGGAEAVPADRGEQKRLFDERDAHS